MENLIQEMITLTNVAFCLMVWVLVWFQRKIIKLAWKKAEESKVYRELLLPMGPVFTGGIMAALIANYPYPDSVEGFWGRLAFGIVAGLASAHVYKMAKPFLPESMGGKKKAEKE